jgi:hypothetical protein
MLLSSSTPLFPPPTDSVNPSQTVPHSVCLNMRFLACFSLFSRCMVISFGRLISNYVVQGPCHFPAFPRLSTSPSTPLSVLAPRRSSFELEVVRSCMISGMRNGA